MVLNIVLRVGYSFLRTYSAVAGVAAQWQRMCVRVNAAVRVSWPSACARARGVCPRARVQRTAHLTIISRNALA